MWKARSMITVLTTMFMQAAIMHKHIPRLDQWKNRKL
jgi:hypothetical protein